MEPAGEAKTESGLRARWRRRRYLLGPLPLLLLIPSIAIIMVPVMHVGFTNIRVYERETVAIAALEALASVESQVKHVGTPNAPTGAYVADLGALEAAFPRLKRLTVAAKNAGYTLEIEGVTTSEWQARATIRPAAKASNFIVDESGEVKASF